MSIKDLFGKTSPSLEETVQDVESVAFVEEKTKADQTYHPQIDFSDPENFVYYGSAELYYDAAIRRIYEDYPYDGSKAEQIAFEESASALERWVFENKYPKTTGHVQLGTTGLLGAALGDYSSTTVNEYIKVWGGLHTDSSAKNLSDHFESSARYDDDKNRNQNWNCDLSEGVTIEFWMKKDSYNFGVYNAEVLLDLWNGQAGANNSRIMLQLFAGSTTTAQFQISVESGADLTPLANLTTGFIDTTEWAHYAITLVETSTNIEARMYINGEEHNLATIASLSAPFSGKIDGFIGALQRTVFSGTEGGLGAGKFQGYLDEFRFWKTKRTSRQIKLNWFNAVGGGANTDDATSDLGVYLKFNEGIVGNNAIDSVVLDYSGRLANGVWVGYESTTSARSTDSAMELAGYTETSSPIIYKEHSLVSALISEMQTSGSVYDADRGQSFFRSMPTWLQEEDNGNLRLFSQILGSYLDTLHVQIKELTELKTKRYPMEGVKASTMAAELLKDKGFMISNMFESNEVYEKLASVNLQDAQFETELHEIKNIIYTNIYNNLEKIYKTKGTEGSIRNLIRCYGIDDELIKLNLYTDGGTQYFTDKSRATSVKKKYVNFNDPTRFEASIHQITSSANPNSFIAGASEASRSAFTMEADIVVPYKKEIDERGYFNTPFLSASVMGFHEADPTDPTDYTWQLNGNDLQVYLVRDSLNSRHAKFVLRNLVGTTINVESDYIYDIYENEHYNVALRIKPQTYPYAGGVTNTTPDYDIELYAVTTNFGEIENEVLLTVSVGYAAGAALMTAPKRVYVGAHVENFTGTTIQQETDLQFGGVRAWLDYLDNDEILQHNKDVLNYGQRSSIDGSNLYLIDDVQIPTQDLTIFNWDFDTVTTTDNTGEFVVEDITSGSADTIYGWVDGIIRREHKAKGTDFTSNDSSIIDYEFIQAYKKQLPESAYDAQNIYIKGDQEINFSDDDDVSDNLFIMEKSPASLISEEMLKSFSTTLEFANLFMRPIERFRVEYKDMARARELFFNKVESDMDFDRFFEYFKWIDSSISSMVNQLVPMSANFAGGIVDVIEPHILERDKYQRQVGLLSTVTSTEASIRGAQELKYNWRVGHAPLSGDENENCLWQKERKERGEPDNPEEQIRQVLVTQNALTASNPINLSGSNGVYAGNTYATRRLSRPYTLDVGFSNSIHGGINYSINKDRDAITQQIAVGNSSNAGTPENVVIIGAGDGTGTNPKPACIDEHKPEELRKYKYDGFAVLGRHSALATQEPKSDADHYAYRQKISKIIPGNIVSSSVNTGYSSLINKDAASGGYGEGFDLVNLHSDTTDITNEISIQGPFTHTHVGGRQSRHVHYMKGFAPNFGYITSSYDRPEAWNIYIAELNADETEVGPGVGDGAIGFTTPDYSVGPLDTDSQKATLYREERAKRPVNIKNIQTIIGTGSHGNFTYNYEVMSTFGDQGYFLRRNQDLLPQPIAQVLPETTNYQTLMAQTASAAGNYFGEGNNRQIDNVVITPPFAGTVASGGEFSVYGRDYVNDGDSISINGTIYKINDIFDADVEVQTGSSDTQFYNNWVTGIESNFADVTVTYNQNLAQGGESLGISDRQGSRGLERATAPSWSASGDFTISFFLKLESNTLGSIRFVYAERSSSGNLRGRRVYIDGTGALKFEVHFVDGSAANRSETYFLNNFTQTYNGNLVHVIISKNATIGAPGSASAIFINGSSIGWDSPSQPTYTGPNVINSPIGFTLGCETIATSNSTGLSIVGETTILDEVVIFNTEITTFDEVQEIYNGGLTWDYDSLSFTYFNYSTDVEAFFTFAEVSDGFDNGDTIYDKKGTNHLTVTDGNPTSDKISQEVQGALSTYPNADFTITPDNVGVYGNFQVTPSLLAGSSFFDEADSTGGSDATPEIIQYNSSNVIETQDRSTGSANVIRTRFSAPGGPEINSSGYLDIATQQFSVYNSINFRNLTTRITGSGEIGTIRVDSQASRREGLRMLRTRHQGQFGIDSTHGAVSAIDYVAEASFHKQHRNKSLIPVPTLDEYGDVISETSPRYDNDHYHRPLPASDIGYSWINYAISGSVHGVSCMMGYAPKSGMRMTEDGWKEAIDFPSGSDVRLDDCSQDPTASPFVTWGNASQFTDDEDFSLFVEESSTTSQTILDFSEIGTLQFSSNNVGCSIAPPLFSLVENGQPRSFGSSVSLPTLYFNPSNSAIFDYATKRSGYVEDQEITLVNVSTDEPILESQINYLQRTTSNGATSVVTKTTNDIIVLVPFSSTPGAFEVTIAEANQSYHSFSSQNIQCADAYQRLEVDSVFMPNDATAPPWNNIPTLYYSSGVFTQVDSTVYMCSNHFEDTISNSFSNATTTAPTLVSNVTFYNDDGSGGRTTETATSKTVTVVPGSSSPGVDEVSEAEANLTTFGYVASSHLADNIDGSLEFELLESDVTLSLNQTFGPQATVPSSFSQIYYSANSSDEVILTLTSRSTGAGFIVEDDCTIIFENATLDNTLLEATVSHPNYGFSGWTTKTVTSDGSRVSGGVTHTVTLKDPSSSTPINSANIITETQANNNLTFSSVGTNMPCGSSATFQLYTTDENGSVQDDGTDPTNSRPNVEYSAGDSVSFRVIVEQCTDSAGNPYSDEITLTIQDARLVSLP